MSRLVVLVLVVVLLSTGAVAATVASGGSTLAAFVYQLWASSYMFVDPTLQISYAGVGSTAGVNGLVSGIYSFAGSDSASLVANVAQGDGMLIPALCGAIVPIYNVPFNGTAALTLNGAILAQIFMGTITSWSDPLIQALNPGLSLPSIPITLIVRSDGSGSSAIFTSALSAFSSQWPQTATGTKPTWPATVTKHYESAGVAIGVRETIGSIGYTGVSYASQYGVPYAQMVNAAGTTVNATTSAILSAMTDFQFAFDGNFSAVIVNAPGNASWPISGYTYLVLKRTTLSDCSVALYLTQFLQWVTSNEDAKLIASSQGFVPVVSVSNALQNQVWTAINQIQCNGQFVTQQLPTNRLTYMVLAAVLAVVDIGLILYTLWVRNQSFMRASNWVAQIASQVGMLILLCSIFVWESNATNAMCHLQVWMTAIGSSILLGRMWAKSVRPWKWLPGYGILTPVTDKLILTATGCMMAVDVLVCIIWSSAGQLQANGLNECQSIQFWGYFGFLLVFKFIILVWIMLASINTPPSLSYFGETLYFVQIASSIIVLCALFLPVIFLVPPTPNEVIRQIFEPSVLIMMVVVAATVIMLFHKIILRSAITRARKALIRERSSSRGSRDPTSMSSSGTHTSTSDTKDEIDQQIIRETQLVDDGKLMGGVAATVVISAADPSNPEQTATIEMSPGDKTSAVPLQPLNQKEHKKGSKSRDLMTANNQNNKRLEKLLVDPASRLRFRQLLGRLRCCEILDFWLAIADYRNATRPSVRIEMARTIHSVFLSVDADEQINLNNKIYTEISRQLAPVLTTTAKMDIETGKIGDEIVLADDIFKAAGDQVFEMMRGIYVEHFVTTNT